MRDNFQIKNNFIKSLFFIPGFAIAYFIPHTAGIHLNKIIQYLFEFLLLAAPLFYFRKSRSGLQYFLGGLISAVSFQLLTSISFYIDVFLGRGVLTAFIAALLLFILFFFYRTKQSFKFILLGLLISTAFQTATTIYITERARIQHPEQWDFLYYYLSGSTAVKGLNFYEPDNYMKVFEKLNIPIKTDYEFHREAVEVGFEYFPQSMFLFLWLANFGFVRAHIIWDIILMLFMFFDIFLILKIFFKGTKFINYVIACILFFLFRAVWYSIVFESYTFIMLFIVLLIWKEKNQNRAGLWLALGAALKPVMILFYLYPLLRKKWKAFFYGIFYFIVCFIISLIYFGPSIVFSFFINNTIQNLPYWSYIDDVNQSLLPTILRITNYHFTLSSPVYHPLYIALGIIISLISFFLIYKLDAEKNELALAVLISFILIIYPSTLNHYILLAEPVIFFLLKNRNSFKVFKYIIPVTITAAFYFMFPIPFVSIMLLWTIVAYLGFYELKAAQTQKKSLNIVYAGK